MPLSLKQRVLKAGSWTVAGFGISQIIRFSSNLLMTRLLAPEMFGVVAIATLVMVGLAMFSDVGLRQNVVQSKRGDDSSYLNTAWIIQILRGTLICVLTLLASLLAAAANHLGLIPMNSVYADPKLPLVMAALSFSVVITGFESTKLLQASRNLVLHRVIQIEVLSQIFGLLFMFGWVWIDRSIWALVAGSLCSNLARTILSHTWLPGASNRWQWDNKAFQEIIVFGRWIFLSSILGFLVNNGDRILLGGFVSSATLGVYTIAFLIAGALENILTKIIGDVSYPALSEVAREHPADLKNKYYQFHTIIAAVAYFFAGILIELGETLIGMLYDARYSEAGWMLEILAISLITIPFRVAPYCLMAIGMPKLLTNIIAIRLVTLFLITPIGFSLFGIHGAIWGIVLSSLSSLPPTIFYAKKFNLFDIRKELSLLLLLPIGIASGMLLNSSIEILKNS